MADYKKKVEGNGANMKHGKNPTVRQKKLISKMGLNVENWLIERDTKGELVIVHRLTDKTRTITY